MESIRSSQNKGQESNADKSSFERIEDETKGVMFGILSLLLKDNEMSFWGFVSITVVSIFQMYQYVFDERMPWGAQSIAHYFAMISGAIELDTWIAYSKITIVYVVLFYVCIFLVLITILNIVFVVYLYIKKRYTLLWPIHLLRSIFNLIITVLFMPILQYLISIFKCTTQSDGGKYHAIYTDMQCWQGLHIIHASFGAIIGIIFVVICITIVYTFFETKSKVNNPSAKGSPKADIFLLLFKTVMVLAYAFFNGDEYRWVLVLLLCCGSTYLFYIVAHEKPYYNEKVIRLVNCLYGGYMYSTYVCLIVMLLYTIGFTGGLQLFVIGYPIFIVIIVVFGDGRNRLLLKSLDDFDSGSEWNLKVKYFITLLSYKDVDKYFNQVLKGYIYDHEDTCTVADCPLKAYKASIMGITGDKKKKQGKVTLVDNVLLLLNYANRMYANGINKFPECATLHISYAFFLIEHMGNKNRAVIELGIAEKSHPSFDEEFIIFRYKKIIEDEMQESHADNSGSLDMVNGIAYENHVRQCKAFIDKAAQFHHEFWTLLMEDKPDFVKLDKSGSKINTAVACVEDHWLKLQKINQNEPKSLRMYAEFLIEVMNDKEAGGELLSRAKDTTLSKNNMMDANVDQNLMLADGAACIVASGETNKLGEILKFNQAACRIFGYNSIDLQGRKISLIIPEMLIKQHDQVMLNTINRNDDLKDNTERIVLGKHKSGYVIALHKYVRTCSSFSQGLQFFATFRYEKKVASNICISYIIIDSNQEIRHLSSSACTMLQLSNRLLQKAKCNISTFCPNMFETNKFNNYLNKGDTVDFFFPEAGRDDESVQSISGEKGMVVERRSQFAPHKSNEEFKPRMNASQTHKATFKCQIKIISFNEIGQVGHFIRLETILPDNQGKCRKYEKIPEFQYLYNVEDKKYYRVMQKPKETDLEKDKKIIEEEESSFEESKVSFSDEDKGENEKKKEQTKNDTSDASKPTDKKATENEEEEEEDEDYEYEEYDEDDEYEESEEAEEEGKKEETKKEMETQNTKKDDEKLTDDEKRKQNVENFLKGIDINDINFGEDDRGMAQLYKERMNYSSTVSTKRIGDDGQTIDIQENQNEEEAKKVCENQKEEDNKEDSTEDKNLELFRNNIKSKKSLNASIRERIEPPAISRLKKTAYLVLVILLTLISSEYGVILSQFSDILDNLKLVEHGYQREALQMRIVYDIGKLVYYRSKFKDNLSNSGFSIGNPLVNLSRARMEYELNSYYTVQNAISMSKISLSDEHNRLYSSKVVTLYFKETDSTVTKKKMYFTLTEAILQMTSSVFTVLNLALTPNNFNPATQDDINFVLYNGFSDINSIILQSSNLYVVELLDRSVSKNKLILIFFILSIAIMLVSIAICFPIIISVSKTRMGVLQLFLNIPMATIKILIQKCEKYTNKSSQDDANEEVDSLNNESFNNTDNNSSINFSQNNSKTVKKRDFSHNNTSNTPFFLKYILGCILLEAYFVVNYTLAIDFLNRVKGYGAELNTTSLLEAHNTYVMSLLQY